MDRQQEFVLRTIEERDIRFVRLWFTDVLGTLKSVAVAPAELEGAFSEGIGFDGSRDRGLRAGLRGGHARQARTRRRSRCCRGAASRPGPRACSATSRRPTARRARRPAQRAQARAVARPPTWGSPSTRTPRSSSTCSRRAGRRAAARAGRHGGLLRPRPARHRARLPPRRDHDARGDGHLGRVQPPRGRPGPERDRPALRRRADHGGQHHDVPHGHQGGRARAGRLRDVHAEAVRGPPRLRACTRTCRCSRATATRSTRPARTYQLSQDRPASSSPACSGTPPRSRRSPTSSSTPTSGCGAAPRRRATSAGATTTAPRSCACRCTSRARASRRRVEIRALDSAANPYLAFALLLAAGLKGIEEGYELPAGGRGRRLGAHRRRAPGAGHRAAAARRSAARSSHGGQRARRRDAGRARLRLLPAQQAAEWEDYRAQVTPFELRAVPAGPVSGARAGDDAWPSTAGGRLARRRFRRRQPR